MFENQNVAAPSLLTQRRLEETSQCRNVVLEQKLWNIQLHEFE